MLIVSSVLWAGWLVLAVSAGLGPHAGRDAIIKQRTAQFRANEALTHETHWGSLADRLDDLERLSGSLANRFQELEKHNRELKLPVTKQSSTDFEQTIVLQQLVDQMEKGMAFLFPDFLTDDGDTHQADRDEKATTKSRMAVLRDYLRNREAEFAVTRPDLAPWETLRGNAKDKDIDLQTVGLALRHLNHKNVELSKQVDELKRFQGTSAGHEEKQNVVRQGNTAIVAGESAFAVASSSSQLGLVGTAQSVAFDHSITNKGGDFRLNNNTFLCRIPGFYHFSFTLRTYGSKVIHVAMMKNDEQLVGINTDQSDRSISSTQTTILQLSEGDAVWLRMPPADICAVYSDGAHYTTFNGFLLYATTS